MNEQRWRRIEDICHDALERAPGHRAAFVREACAGDEALRGEVESLVANQSRAEALGSGLGIRDSGLGIRTEELIGKQIGVYRIDSLLGAGGMGQVYRARDTKLGRDVAVKFLPHAFMKDPDRLARFEREARMLASLNHPHIGGIYGFEEYDRAPALVLELVEGLTLADRLALRGPISVGESLEIAKQIADALDAAHERGIVHRDLKPANIKITPAGIVKVLDFGLAKVFAGDASGPDLTQSPTVTVDGTREGAIFGTAAYMSPEQARGQVVDKRADIWAFGCVLYEMLTARSPFLRATVTDTLAAVVDREPDWTVLPAAIPPEVLRLIRHCLEKEPKLRVRDIGDARAQLKNVEGPFSQPTGASSPSLKSAPRSTLLWSALAATAGVGATLIAVLALRTVPDAVPGFDRIVRMVSTPAYEFAPAISPDGKWVAYLSDARGQTDVWVKFVAGGDPANLTESADIVVQSQDFISGLDISPDGTQIAFTAARPGTSNATAWVIPAPLGGIPRPLLKGTIVVFTGLSTANRSHSRAPSAPPETPWASPMPTVRTYARLSRDRTAGTFIGHGGRRMDSTSTSTMGFRISTPNRRRCIGRRCPVARLNPSSGARGARRFPFQVRTAVGSTMRLIRTASISVSGGATSEPAATIG